MSKSLISGDFQTLLECHSRSVTVLSPSRDGKAVVNIGVSALNRFIRYYVRHQHSTLEGDHVRAGRNTYDLEFSSLAVVLDTSGPALAQNHMQFPTPIAHDPIPHWHVAIMIPRRVADDSVLSRSFSSGGLGTYQPFITSRRNPLAFKRSLWVRGTPPLLDSHQRSSAHLAEHYSDERLSGREIDILRQLAGGNRNRDIADKLFISEDTIKAHLKHIMEKLGASGNGDSC